MKLALDQYADLKSPIHRWEQRSKLVALLSLIFSFAFIETLVLLLPMVAITATLYYLSRLPLSFLLKRLRYPGLFILAVVLLLPLVSGETVLFSIGPLAVKQEGCIAVVLIVTRFICILTISLILFGTAPFLSSIKAMRSLGLSRVLVDIILLSYRYLEAFAGTLTTMQRAMRLRGFQSDRLTRRNLSSLAALIGSLLVRSYDQSQRVYQAMILRGYNCSCPHQQQPLLAQIVGSDRHSQVAFCLLFLIAVGLMIAEGVWSINT